MNKAFVALVGASALVASTAGFAGGPSTAVSAPVDNSAGFYVNGNLGFGRYGLSSSDVNAYNAVGFNVDRNSIAWSANVGYQFNPYIAVEAGYMQLPYARFTVPGVSGHADLDTSAFTVDAKGIYPINEQFDVFAKAGLAVETQSLSGSTGPVVASHNHQVLPLFGLGVDYNINQNWAVGVQGIATLKSGGITNASYYPATYTALAGVTYKFS